MIVFKLVYDDYNDSFYNFHNTENTVGSNIHYGNIDNIHADYIL